MAEETLEMKPGWVRLIWSGSVELHPTNRPRIMVQGEDEDFSPRSCGSLADAMTEQEYADFVEVWHEDKALGVQVRTYFDGGEGRTEHGYTTLWVHPDTLLPLFEEAAQRRLREVMAQAELTEKRLARAMKCLSGPVDEE